MEPSRGCPSRLVLSQAEEVGQGVPGSPSVLPLLAAHVCLRSRPDPSLTLYPRSSSGSPSGWLSQSSCG